MKKYFLILTLFFLFFSISQAAEGVQIKQISPNQFKVSINGSHFTTYNYGDELNGVFMNKPVLWPVLSSKGTPITRDYPFRKGRIKEQIDHPHHQGVFFTYGLLNYGDVDSINVWGVSKRGPYPHSSYGKSGGQIINRKNIVLKEGKSVGILESVNDWVSHAVNKVFLTEDRKMAFGTIDNSRYIDFVFRFSTKDQPVTWVDTKEGMFAIRLTPAMREYQNSRDKRIKEIKSGHARYLNASGDELESGVWGKRSPWVALRGILETGEPLTIIMMDHPDNLNYPTFWHARGYGLFSLNPFGMINFTHGKQVFNFKLPVGGHLTLKYRMLFYEGQPDKIGIENLYNSYTQK